MLAEPGGSQRGRKPRSQQNKRPDQDNKLRTPPSGEARHRCGGDSLDLLSRTGLVQHRRCAQTVQTLQRVLALHRWPRRHHLQDRGGKQRGLSRRGEHPARHQPQELQLVLDRHRGDMLAFARPYRRAVQLARGAGEGHKDTIHYKLRRATQRHSPRTKDRPMAIRLERIQPKTKGRISLRKA